MGADILAGIIVSVHGVLGHWIICHFAPHPSRFRQLVTKLCGIASGMALGFALSYLLITLLLGTAIPALNSTAILKEVILFMPFVLAFLAVESLTERKSHDYRVVAGFLAFLAAFIICMASYYLFFVLIPGHEVTTSFSSAFYVGAIGGMLYTRLLLWIAEGLTARSV